MFSSGTCMFPLKNSICGLLEICPGVSILVCEHSIFLIFIQGFDQNWVAAARQDSAG